jgi:hypothetical protein
VEDPDPYGVKALQAEGFEIREAGTKTKPSPDVFEFKPATTSPIYSNFRKSIEFRERANSWRGSMQSIASVDKGTQTDEEEPRSAGHSPVKRSSQPPSPIRKETEHVQDSSDDDGDQVHGADSLDEEPLRIQTAVPVVARARMVVVPKRVPPSLPPRNPNRMSPLKSKENGMDGFDNVSLNGSDHSDNTLEKRKSSVESENGLVKAQIAPIDDKNHLGVNGVPVMAGEDEFHSVPPSPAREHHQVPGAF